MLRLIKNSCMNLMLLMLLPSLSSAKQRGADVADAPAFRAPEAFNCETEGH